MRSPTNRLVAGALLPSIGRRKYHTHALRHLADEARVRKRTNVGIHKGIHEGTLNRFLNPPGVGQFFLGESQSRLYPHMRAKFGRGPTFVSKKLSFKFISRCYMLWVYSGLP